MQSKQTLISVCDIGMPFTLHGATGWCKLLKALGAADNAAWLLQKDKHLGRKGNRQHQVTLVWCNIRLYCVIQFCSTVSKPMLTTSHSINITTLLHPSSVTGMKHGAGQKCLHHFQQVLTQAVAANFHTHTDSERHLPAVSPEPPPACCCLRCPGSAFVKDPVLMCLYPGWWRSGWQSSSPPKSSSALDQPG